ncbi:hypothetical protein BS50DRAFT_584721 [Corynespora cassiicola Philippines]|uniref:Uncharacterized protein n=1 Tax=Corynespora cassiicola Philippines TaxID=1448308 RepID=A0A2T2P0L7_CORCC|nr:hypothetical protein BS50DRAFT_584721 [Corynespora cassiicola Philippines]
MYIEDTSAPLEAHYSGEISGVSGEEPTSAEGQNIVGQPENHEGHKNEKDEHGGKLDGAVRSATTNPGEGVQAQPGKREAARDSVSVDKELRSGSTHIVEAHPSNIPGPDMHTNIVPAKGINATDTCNKDVHPVIAPQESAPSATTPSGNVLLGSTSSNSMHPDQEECQSLISSKQNLGEKLHIDPPERFQTRFPGWRAVMTQTGISTPIFRLTWSTHVGTACVRCDFYSFLRSDSDVVYNGAEILPSPGNIRMTFLHFWRRRYQQHAVGRRGNTKQRFVTSDNAWWYNNHVVVGIMNRWTGVPRERLIRNVSLSQFLRYIHRVSRMLRPWWVRVFSLKSIQGFAIYQCYPNDGHHSAVDLDHHTELVLQEFYHDYMYGEDNTGSRWLHWIQQHFNQGDSEPDKPRLALQLVLRWDGRKIGFYGLTPVLLSLAVGFWLQYSQKGDRIAVIHTAWTVSGYILGAASILIAIGAAITQGALYAESNHTVPPNSMIELDDIIAPINSSVGFILVGHKYQSVREYRIALYR